MGRSLFVALGAILVATMGTGCGGSGGTGGSAATPGDPLSGNIQIEAHHPAHREVQVPLDAAVAVLFDSAIYPGSIESGQITLKAAGGAPLLGSFSLGSGSRQVTFQPFQPLAESTDYTVTVQTLVFDHHYRTLARDQSFVFRSLDRTPPVVKTTTPPASAAGVSPQDALTVEFSEEMDPATVTAASVLLRDPWGREVACSRELAGSRLVVTPEADLLGGRHHEFILRGRSQGMKDRSGNPLAADLSVPFDTALDLSGPVILGQLPPGNAGNVAPGAALSFTFDDSIDPWSLEPTSVLLLDEASSNIPLTFEWGKGYRTLALVPALPLVPGGRYHVAFPGGVGGIANMSGTPLPMAEHFNFTAGGDDAVPAVESVLPVDRATGVAVNAVLQVVFTRPICEASVTAETVQLIKNGHPVGCTRTLTGGGTILSLQPAAVLEPATAYKLILTGGCFGVLAENYRGLAGKTVLTFTTTADTQVPTATLYPPNGSGYIAVNTRFVAAFSEPVAPATVTSDTVRLRVLDSGAWVSGTLALEGDGRVVRFTPALALPAGKALCFSVTGGAWGVMDRQGNWLSRTAQASVTTGHHEDRTPPVTSMTVNGIAENLNANLDLPPFGFTINVSGYDPTDAALDPSSLRLTLTGVGGFYPTTAQLLALTRFLAQDQVQTEIPPSAPCGMGAITIRASLADLAGNRSPAATLAATVVSFTNGQRPLERNQLVLVDFTADREGRGRGDGVADWYQDLLDYGLVAPGDPIGRNAYMLEIMNAAVLAKAHDLYGRQGDGNPQPGAVAIRFIQAPPGAGIPFMRMALGGQDPEEGKRVLGQSSTGVLGRAWYDYKNRNFADNNAGTSPGLGVFPGELFLYQANLYQRLYPGYVTAFGRRFRLLSPHLGGTPAGKDPLDATILDPTFDYARGTAAQRSRYLAVFQAADDLAVLVATLLAHEAAHSLGLVTPGPPPGGLWGEGSLHVDHARPGNLMNAVVGYDALVEEVYRFRPLNLAYLREQILLR